MRTRIVVGLALLFGIAALSGGTPRAARAQQEQDCQYSCEEEGGGGGGGGCTNGAQQLVNLGCYACTYYDPATQANVPGQKRKTRVDTCQGGNWIQGTPTYSSCALSC
ncbi:MAG: hypothetical protein K2X99_07830 [Gemmatimonadaceae bacterium]|nr:hypothetical protein [Gemmatimonadaceae bacterium]